MSLNEDELQKLLIELFYNSVPRPEPRKIILHLLTKEAIEEFDKALKEEADRQLRKLEDGEEKEV